MKYIGMAIMQTSERDQINLIRGSGTLCRNGSSKHMQLLKYFCTELNDNVEAARKLYLASGLMAITNKPLELGI
jgi:hypothetical protein